MSEGIPSTVYAEDADFVTLAMQRLTADRMSGWLSEYAEFQELAGNDKTAEHARAVSERLEREVDAGE